MMSSVHMIVPGMANKTWKPPDIKKYLSCFSGSVKLIEAIRENDHRESQFENGFLLNEDDYSRAK